MVSDSFNDTARWMQEEIIQEQSLDPKDRSLALFAFSLGSGGTLAAKETLEAALKEGSLSLTEAQEILFQATPYLGQGKTEAMAEVLLPILGPIPQKKRSPKERQVSGTAAQVAIFGEAMADFYQKSDVNRYLAENCFGDYYTRSGLSLAQRELATFCFLVALGGVDPQVKAHVQGNLNQGHDAAFLRKVVLLGIPLIGYPHALNGLAAIKEVAEKEGK